MFNTPNSFFAYCALTGHVRTFTRGVGIRERTSEPRQHRRWPALLAHVERLRGAAKCQWCPNTLLVTESGPLCGPCECDASDYEGEVEARG